MKKPRVKLSDLNPVRKKYQKLQQTADVRKFKKLSKLAYQKRIDDSELQGTDYQLDPTLSTDEHKVFYNPTQKHVTIAYRGTELKDKGSQWKDLKSNVTIMFGKEKHNRRFKEANEHFKKVYAKYGDNFDIHTTGHSLGGQLSKYVNDSHKGKIKSNVAFNRGSGFLEPFRKKQQNTLDVFHNNDLISLGARLQKGNQIHTYSLKTGGSAHSLEAV